MTKKHFIALADAIREHNKLTVVKPFDKDQLDTLGMTLRSINPNFKHERWLGYIAGTNGKNGGKVTK